MGRRENFWGHVIALLIVVFLAGMAMLVVDRVKALLQALGG